MTVTNKFHAFHSDIGHVNVPTVLRSPFNVEPPEIAVIAAHQLQAYLEVQTDWRHNFGLTPGMEGKEIGKMFGVLVVQKEDGSVGFLAGFSGKLAGVNHHTAFVPPIYDSLEEGGFLNTGMDELGVINQKIKSLESEQKPVHLDEIMSLKEMRKEKSNGLQRKLFDHYHFLNYEGITKTPWELFPHNAKKLPPSGAGECAAPKMFQYAFIHHLKPLAIAEFWWGKSTKSRNQQHKAFYPACKEKCWNILEHMLMSGSQSA